MTTNSVNINDDGLPVFNSTTGQFSAAELTTKGDLLTRTTSIYTREGVGTNGEALICDSTETTGLNYGTIAAGSSTIFLESQTASSSASIDFTAAFDDSTYAYYLFTYVNVKPATDGVDFRSRVSVNTGSSWLTSDYQWVRVRYSSSSGARSINEDDSDSRYELAGTVGNATREGISGKMIFIPSSNPGSVRAGPIMFDNVYYRDDGVMYRNFGGGMNETSSQIDAIQFLMSSGNIAHGIFKMYGVKNSL